MRDSVDLALELVQAQKLIEEQSRIIQQHEQSISHLCKDLTQANKRIADLRAQLKSGQGVDISIANPPDTVVDLVVRLAARERKVFELTEELGRKNLQIVELEEKLKEAQQAGKRQAHPFRRRKRKPKSKHKKPGRRKGRGEFKRREEPTHADRTETVPLTECPHCRHKDLPELKDFVNWQIDIPHIKPEITRFNTQGCTCPRCHSWIQSQHPEQLSTAMGAANITLGPRAIAAAADMHERHGMSYGKIANVFSELLNFRVTESCLCKCLDRLLAKAEPVYEELIHKIRQCTVVHADETGWRIGALNAWLWVFTNTQICVYTIRSGKGARGHEAILEVLGREFRGTLVSDCFVAYDKDCFDEWLKQKCYSHLLKAFKELSESKKAEAVAFAIDVCTFLTETMKLKELKEELCESAYDKECADVEKDLDDLLDRYSDVEDKDSVRLRNRLVKHREHLLTFLYHDEVGPTNNTAERDVRPSVLARKTQGCNKTDRGARKHAVLSSIIVTARKQGRPVIETLEGMQLPNHPPGTVWGDSLSSA